VPPRGGFFRLDQNIPRLAALAASGCNAPALVRCVAPIPGRALRRGDAWQGCRVWRRALPYQKEQKRVDMGGLRMRVSKGQRGATGRVREAVLFPCMAAALLLVLAPSASAGGVGVAATPAARAAQAPEDTSGVNEYTEQGIPGEPADNATGSPKSGQSAPGSRSTGSQGAGAAGSQGAGAADASGSQGDRADDDAAAGSRPTATSGAGDQSTRTSTLPRTGIDAWLLVTAGLALLGSGVLLRWAEAARPVGLFSSSRNARGVYLSPAGPQAGFRTKSR